MHLFTIYQLVCWSQEFYTETSYTWTDKDTVPIYFRAAEHAAGLHQVVLTIDTHSNPNSLEFFLTYPNGNTDVLAPGAELNTSSDPNLGVHVSFQELSSDEYQLAITKNPADSGTFPAQRVWGLTVDNLGDTNTLEASIAFYDTSAAVINPASFATPVGIIPNGFYWVNNECVFVPIQIPGADLPGVIHQVNIYFYTNGNPEDFSLRALSHGSGVTLFSVNKPSFNTYLDADIDNGTTGVHLEMEGYGSGFCVMKITANPEICTLSGTDCEFDYNEDWVFLIDDLEVENDTVVLVQTFPYGCPPSSSITPDPIDIYYPPLLLAPKDGAADTNTAVTFSWQHTTDLDREDIDYYLYVSEDPAFNSADVYTVHTAKQDTIRYAGTGILCMVLLLLTGAGGLYKSRGLRTALLALLILTSFMVLSCSLSESGEPSGGGKDVPGISMEVSGLKPGTTYYWKVRVDDGQEHETWDKFDYEVESEVRSFTTAF
jgi:hypothetical protein